MIQKKEKKIDYTKPPAILPSSTKKWEQALEKTKIEREKKKEERKKREKEEEERQLKKIKVIIFTLKFILKNQKYFINNSFVWERVFFNNVFF